MNLPNSCATSSAIFNRWHVQTERDESAELQNVWQHQEELTHKARCQSGEGRGKEDARPLRRGAGHREHNGPFPLPLAEIMPIRLTVLGPGTFGKDWPREQAQQRLSRESANALNSHSNSNCRVLRDEP